jgi:acetyltransferase-like isoleucine patch superfamily enzyme
VGAGTVVTKDLEPWGVYLGNRRIRDRDRERVLATHRRFQEDAK